jgi:hypothetical protein
MVDPTVLCPNCHTAWPEGASVCPHCGYVPSPALAFWPPPPSKFQGIPQPPPGPKLVTGKVWGDVTFGLSLSFLSNFLYCIGFLVMPILYFTLKPKYPAFARGIGFGTLAGLIVLVVGVIISIAVLLGALATCKFPS